jgi:hypothetical protein
MTILPEWTVRTIAVLVTMDRGPHAIPVSAPVRADGDTIMLSLHRSRDSLTRLRRRPEVALTVLAEGDVAFTARGTARVIDEPMTDAPLSTPRSKSRSWTSATTGKPRSRSKPASSASGSTRTRSAPWAYGRRLFNNSPLAVIVPGLDQKPSNREGRFITYDGSNDNATASSRRQRRRTRHARRKRRNERIEQPRPPRCRRHAERLIGRVWTPSPYSAALHTSSLVPVSRCRWFAGAFFRCEPSMLPRWIQWRGIDKLCLVKATESGGRS